MTLITDIALGPRREGNEMLGHLRGRVWFVAARLVMFLGACSQPQELEAVVEDPRDIVEGLNTTPLTIFDLRVPEAGRSCDCQHA